jgi:hypothetical protein
VSKGDIPIPYIVALILGIIVIGVIGYWFFVLSGKGGGTASEQFCRAKELTYCSQWSKCDYSTAPGTDCRPGKQTFDKYAPECRSYDWALAVNDDACREILGQKT